MNKIIEIIVAPNGQTKVETKGFTGNQCQQASKFIEQALGKRCRSTGEYGIALTPLCCHLATASSESSD